MTSSGDPRTWLGDRLTANAPLTWIFTGDSITHGLKHTVGVRSYSEHIHEILRGDLLRTRDTIVNTAVTGNRIIDILDDFDHRVGRWGPDIVVLMIGTNDCARRGRDSPIALGEFPESIAEFVSRVRDLGATPILQTPPPVDAASATEHTLIELFAQAIRDVAAQESVLLIDQYSFLTGLAMEGAPLSMMSDDIHPNAAGHAALALNLAAEIGIVSTSTRTIDVLRQLAGLLDVSD